MIDELARPLLIFLFCLVRPLAAFRTAPLLGASVMPPQTLNAFAMTLAILFYPIAEVTAPQTLELSWLLLPLIVKELFIGLIIGFFFGILFWVAQSVGFLIDNERGASMAQGMDPLSGDQLSPFASLFFQFAAMLFFTSGAFVSFIGMLMESYAVWPIFEYIPKLTGAGLQNLLLLQADAVLRLAVMLAAPIMALCFLTDFGLGLINRFAQQLNVFVLAMPLKSAVALFVLTFYAMTMLGVFQNGIRDMDFVFGHLREALQ
ncbi:MAG: type III secretion system export apparatus subunit SctT [Deltaproteobacteria bacterium]|jgi:type III secretion protein T|nr:type III secretion system export apparatus subunit SctT [Deltaproteobacteria bacterium]